MTANRPSRTFCFTLNNYKDEELASIVDFAHSEACTYLCYGLEVASTGTPHVQGYCAIRAVTRPNAFQRKFREEFSWVVRAHFEAANGTREQNRLYCFKQREQDPTPNEIIFENENSKQGRRTDLEEACETLREGGCTAVAQAHSNVFVKYHSGFRALQSVIFSDRDPSVPPNIWWWYGPTGTGKTRQAFDFARDKGLTIWKSSKDLRWWQGYEQQQICLVDDFRKDFCKFHELLTILDRYPYSVEVKGSAVPLNSPYIIVTSCYPPWQVYDTREDVGQLLRRIGQVVHFTGGCGEGGTREIADVPRPFVPGAHVGHRPAGQLRIGESLGLDGFAPLPGAPPPAPSAYAPGFVNPWTVQDSVPPAPAGSPTPSEAIQDNALLAYFLE